MSEQFAPIIVTDECLAAWEAIADAEQPHIRLGGINWTMIVRSLIAEIKILRSTGANNVHG